VTDADEEVQEALRGPNLLVGGGLDRYSDSPAPLRPRVEAALDQWLYPPASPDRMEQLSSVVSPDRSDLPGTSGLSDQSGLPSTSAPPDAPSAFSDCDVDTRESDSGALPGRPRLSLADQLVAAVKTTRLVDVSSWFTTTTRLTRRRCRPS